MRMVVWVAALNVLLDQLSKYLVVHGLDLIRVERIEVWPPFLVFQMAWNYGVNFGLMAGDAPMTRWILIMLAFAICIAVLAWVHYRPEGKWQFLAAGLVVGGAIGNVIDRLIYGAVADFLNMSCCGIKNPYSFNIADISIFAGVIVIILFTGNKKAA